MAHSPADPASLKPASLKEAWVFDPAYLICLRELKIIFAFFFAVLGWSIGVSYYLGYGGAKDAPVELLLGVPKWFLWGVATPWATATVISILFALVWMKDHAAPDSDSESPS